MTENYKKLWFKVLRQAIEDAQKSWMESGVYSKRIAEGARQWFISSNQGVCSFRWICNVLDLEPEYVRRFILNKCEPCRTRKLA